MAERVVYTVAGSAAAAATVARLVVRGDVPDLYTSADAVRAAWDCLPAPLQDWHSPFEVRLLDGGVGAMVLSVEMVRLQDG